jgi:hypothetical protein
MMDVKTIPQPKKKPYYKTFFSGIHWTESRLNYFTFPQNFTRNQSITFCSNNNGVLMYWANLTEQEIFQS